LSDSEETKQQQITHETLQESQASTPNHNGQTRLMKKLEENIVYKRWREKVSKMTQGKLKKVLFRGVCVCV
jgi:hypothetical protein